MDDKEEAKKVLKKNNWGKVTIDQALCSDSKNNDVKNVLDIFINFEGQEINSKIIDAISILHDEGWGDSRISRVIALKEHLISSILTNKPRIDDLLIEISP